MSKIFRNANKLGRIFMCFILVFSFFGTYISLPISSVEAASKTMFYGKSGDKISVGQWSSQKVKNVKASSNNKKVKTKVFSYKEKGTRKYSVLAYVPDAYSIEFAKKVATITVSYYDKSKKKTIKTKKSITFYNNYQYKTEELVVLPVGKSIKLSPLKRNGTVKTRYVYPNNRPGLDMLNKYFVKELVEEDYGDYKLSASGTTLKVIGKAIDTNGIENNRIDFQTIYSNGEVISQEHKIIMVDGNNTLPKKNVSVGDYYTRVFDIPTTAKLTVANSNKAAATVSVQTRKKSEMVKKDKTISTPDKKRTMVIVKGKQAGKTTIKLSYQNSRTGKKFAITIPVHVASASQTDNNTQIVTLIGPHNTSTYWYSEYAAYLLDKNGNRILPNDPYTIIKGEAGLVDYGYLVHGGIGKDFNVSVQQKDLYGKLLAQNTIHIIFEKGTVMEAPEYKFTTTEDAIEFFSGKWYGTDGKITFDKENMTAIGFDDFHESDSGVQLGEVFLGDDPVAFVIDHKRQTISFDYKTVKYSLSYKVISKSKILLSSSDKDWVFDRSR